MLLGSELQNFCIEELDALPTDSTKYRMVVVNDRLYMSKKNGGWLEIYTNNNTVNLPIISSGDASKVVEVSADETGYILNGHSIKAWGRISITDTTPTILSSFNVDSVTGSRIAGNGIAQVTLLNPFVDLNYVVVATNGRSGVVSIVDINDTDKFTIYSTVPDSQNPFVVSFIAIGAQ